MVHGRKTEGVELARVAVMKVRVRRSIEDQVANTRARSTHRSVRRITFTSSWGGLGRSACCEPLRRNATALMSFDPLIRLICGCLVSSRPAVPDLCMTQGCHSGPRNFQASQQPCRFQESPTVPMLWPPTAQDGSPHFSATGTGTIACTSSETVVSST